MPGLRCEARDLTITVSAGSGQRQRIVDAVALDLRPGTLTVLSGPSGSGKSTLLYLLCGLLVPDTGAVIWGGDDLSHMGEMRRDRWRRENAGFVFQEFHLIEELSPLDNVLLPGWFSGLSVRGLRQRAGALLEQLGVPAERRRLALLSRGEQQRVAIARALLFDPVALFADEPTASLDRQAGETVARTLSDLAVQEGRTVIVASHDPAVLAVSDRVVAIERGRVRAPESAGAA